MGDESREAGKLVVNLADAHVALADSIASYREYSRRELKEYLRGRGVKVGMKRWKIK